MRGDEYYIFTGALIFLVIIKIVLFLGYHVPYFFIIISLALLMPIAASVFLDLLKAFDQRTFGPFNFFLSASPPLYAIFFFLFESSDSEIQIAVKALLAVFAALFFSMIITGIAWWRRIVLQR